MNLSYREKYQYLLTFLVDLAATAWSAVLTYLLFGVGLQRIVAYTVPDIVQYLCILFVAFLGAFLSFDQSENISRRNVQKEIILSVRFNLILVALTAILLLATKANMSDSRYILLGVPLLNCVFLLAGHQLLKVYLLKNNNKNITTRLVGLVSTVDRASGLIETISKDWTVSLHGMALLDASDKEVGAILDGVKIEANFDGFMDWIRLDALDEIYIDLPTDTGASLLPYLQELESMGVDIHLNIPMLDRLNKTQSGSGHFRPIMERCGNRFLLNLCYNQHTVQELILKRAMDILGGLVGCIISVPIIAIVAIPLKIESPGPLFFKQKRVGLNGRYFYIYKLRSMYQDAEARKKELMAKNEMNGLMFKITDDPRITKVGKFIRKTSIDELPQFWNVLHGDMSLVGTRPPTVDEYEKYESHHKRRLSMKPGITGAWQVSGRSNIENFEDVVKMDVDYIDNWSFWLDIKILFKTVAVVFVGRGAK